MTPLRITVKSQKEEKPLSPLRAKIHEVIFEAATPSAQEGHGAGGLPRSLWALAIFNFPPSISMG